MPDNIQAELGKSTLNRSNTLVFLQTENDNLRRVVKVLCGALSISLVFSGLFGGGVL